MSSDMADISILGLAERILEDTKNITQYLQARGLSSPTFSERSTSLPHQLDSQGLLSGLRESLEDLKLLIEGPEKFYRHFLMRGYELAAFQIALDFKFFTLVPSEGDISLDDLAIRAGLDKDRTTRVIRLLITHRFFRELKLGFISHNFLSVALQDDELRTVVHYS